MKIEKDMNKVRKQRLNMPKATLKEAQEQAGKVKIAAEHGKFLRAHYPVIYKLGIQVDFQPFAHITSINLKKGLKKNKINSKKFHKAFGINTMALSPKGETMIYLCDIEKALKVVLYDYKPSVFEWD